MTENTEYTEEQQAEIEAIFTLLAGSNRWEHYVGLTRDTEKIDRLIKMGKLIEAKTHLQVVATNFLTYDLASVAIRAREAHLIAVGIIDEMVLTPTLDGVEANVHRNPHPVPYIPRR